MSDTSIDVPLPSGPDSARRGRDDDSDELSVLDVVIVLAKYKLLIVGVCIAAGMAGTAYSLRLPDVFTASARLLPPQQSQSPTLSLLGQFASLASLSTKTSSDLYAAMLMSRTVADAMIERLGLNKVFATKSQSETRDVLAGMTSIKVERDGMITIAVDDVDPNRAALLANAYAEELQRLTGVLAVTEASKRRLFFERELVQAKQNLAKAEASTRESIQHGGLVQVEGQGRSLLETTARLRAQITAKEVEIGVMRSFAADSNPELTRAQHELDVIRRELAKVESGGGAAKHTGGGANNLRGIGNLTLLRDLKYHETVYELLARQYGIAKLDEARDSAIIQVLDKAVPPETKSKPQRRTIVMLAVVAAGMLACLLAFVLEAAHRAKLNPQQAARLDALRKHLRGM